MGYCVLRCKFMNMRVSCGKEYLGQKEKKEMGDVTEILLYIIQFDRR